MERGTDIRTLTGSLGFGRYLSVQSRLTIADLFRPNERSGLYAIYFSNGEGYVGRTTDIVRRFGQHRDNHDDIQELAFRPLDASKQDEEEQVAIRTCESAGVHLRNFQFMSVIRGPNDLDLVMLPDEQTRWLETDVCVKTFLQRPNDEGLRRRYEKRFARLKARPQWQAIKVTLQEYAATCLPAADRTEMSFWSASCLAGDLINGIRILIRINIFWQEVMTVFIDKTDLLWFTFHGRLSILDQRHFVVPPYAGIEDHYYEPGGEDQIKIVACDEKAGNILSLIDDPVFRSAAKDFNLNLMRKGANICAGSHCYPLADEMLAVNKL